MQAHRQRAASTAAPSDPGSMRGVNIHSERGRPGEAAEDAVNEAPLADAKDGVEDAGVHR